MRLSDFRALSFDCYGTLIDWEAGILAALQPLIARSGITDEDLLEAYGPIEHAVEAEFPDRPYSELLREVHERLSRHFGVEPDAAAAAAFGTSVGAWPAFSDSPAALAYLQQHFQLIILSNVDAANFTGSERRLGVKFDHVFTAQDIGSYKPDLRNFEYLLEHLAKTGIAKGELLHVAQSLFHDHAPANRMGIASAWIDRRAGKTGSGATAIAEPMPRFDFRFTSLGELAEAHQAELEAR